MDHASDPPPRSRRQRPHNVRGGSTVTIEAGGRLVAAIVLPEDGTVRVTDPRPEVVGSEDG